MPDTSPHPQPNDGFPSFRAIQMDVRKGKVSYRIGFSECEFGRASDSQHARSALFNDSCRRCQEQNSDQFGWNLGPETPVISYRPDKLRRVPEAAQSLN